MMNLAILALAAAALHTSLAFIALDLFGVAVAYIITTGTLLLRGIVIYSSQPVIGFGVPFLVVAVGQTAGAPFFGMVWKVYGVVSALLVSAATMASAADFTAINSQQ